MPEEYLNWMERYASSLSVYLVVAIVVFGLLAVTFAVYEPIKWAVWMFVTISVTAFVLLVTGPGVYTIVDRAVRFFGESRGASGSLPTGVETSGLLSNRLIIAGNYCLSAAVLVIIAVGMVPDAPVGAARGGSR